MSRKPQIFEHESLQDADNLAAFLKAIAKGIKKGEIIFTDEDDTLTLRPKALGRFRVKVEKSPKSQSLRLKITWQGDDEGDIDDTPLFIETR
jgi:amphi-Trp domain-containing protein